MLSKEELEETRKDCPSFKKGLCASNLFNVCYGQCAMTEFTKDNKKKKEKK